MGKKDMCDFCPIGKGSINFNMWLETLIKSGEMAHKYNIEDLEIFNSRETLQTRMIKYKESAVIDPNRKIIDVTNLKNMADEKGVDMNSISSPNDFIGKNTVLLYNIDDIENSTLVHSWDQMNVGSKYAVCTIYRIFGDGNFILMIPFNIAIQELYLEEQSVQSSIFPLPTQLDFVYFENNPNMLIGNPLDDVSIDEILGLIAYINKRIDKLCIPCCTKDKINEAIVNYANGYLVTGLTNQTFTSFCDSDIIPKCGPIYVANVIISDVQQAELQEVIDYWRNPTEGDNTDYATQINNKINSIQFIMNLLRIAKYYLKTFINATNCCDNESNEHVSFEEVCECVFGRFCIVDVSLPAFDLLFDDWQSVLNN